MPGAHSEPLHPSIPRRMEEAAYLTAQNVRHWIAAGLYERGT